HEETRREAPVTIASPAPIPAATAPHAPPAAHVEFHAVSEHEESIEPIHRPSRRRRHEGGEASAAQPLQLVETQAEAPAAIEPETDLPRRTRPRRRRSAPAESGPLQ